MVEIEMMQCSRYSSQQIRKLQLKSCKSS